MASMTLRPNANGDVNDWSSTETANYLAVDEVTADDDATYNYTSSTGTLDLYNIEDPPADFITHPIYVIDSVTVYCRAKEITAGSDAYIVVRTYGTDYTYAMALETTYQTLSTTLTTNPYTGSAWTWTEIQNLQIGIKTFPVAIKGAEYRVTQMYVVVEYSLPVVEKVKHPYTHLDKGPHPRSRLGFYPRLGL